MEYAVHVARANVPDVIQFRGARLTVKRMRHHDDPRWWIYWTPVLRLRLVDRSRYDGAKLRKLRAERGVGRPPKRKQ